MAYDELQILGLMALAGAVLGPLVPAEGMPAQNVWVRSALGVAAGVIVLPLGRWLFDVTGAETPSAVMALLPLLPASFFGSWAGMMVGALSAIPGGLMLIEVDFGIETLLAAITFFCVTGLGLRWCTAALHSTRYMTFFSVTVQMALGWVGILLLSGGLPVLRPGEPWTLSGPVGASIVTALAPLAMLLPILALRGAAISEPVHDDAVDRLSLAARASGFGFWEVDLTSGTLTWDGVQAKLHGMVPPVGVLTLSDWRNCIHPDDRGRFDLCIERIRSGNERCETEMRVLLPDKRVHHLRLAGMVRRRSMLGPQRVLGVTMDVTQLRESELAASELTTCLQEVARTMPGALYALRVEPDGTETVWYLNPHCAELFEVDLGGPTGDADLLLGNLCEAAREVQQRLIRRSVTDLEDWVHEGWYCGPGGSQKLLQFRARPRRLADGAVEFSILAIDITEQFRMKEQLTASQRMFFEAQRLDGMGKLTGGIAHDFNNILAIIMGNLELLAMRSDMTGKSEIGAAILACKRGSKLMRQLLAFSRRAPLQPERIELPETLRAIASRLASTMPEGIAVEVEIQGDPPPIYVDAQLFEMSLFDLAMNAREAMDGEGLILIRAEALPMGSRSLRKDDAETAERTFVRVSVTDTGCGMDDLTAGRIFDPFFTTKPPGTAKGMGLAMLHGFVAQSEGFVEVETAPGKGTTFHLCFPADVPEELPRAKSRRMQAAELDQAHVLLVDDDDAVRATIARHLHKMGCRVTECRSGVDALTRVLSGEDVDLLLTDVVMPGRIQGHDLEREAERLRPGLPVLLMSGYPQDLPYGADLPSPQDIDIMKPVDFKELRRILRENLRGAKMAG